MDGERAPWGVGVDGTYQGNSASRATELRIDLHAHVRMVLLLVFHQVCALYALRDDAKAAVGRLLDAGILFSILAV